MSTAKQARAVLATEGALRHLVAQLVDNQKYFGQLPRGVAYWATQHPQEASRLFLEVVKKQRIFFTKPKESFANLLAACQQTRVSRYFTESSCPLEPVIDNEDEYEVRECHLSEGALWTLEEGLQQLHVLALRGNICLLTGSRRAMKYISKHLDVQLERTLIIPLRVRGSNGCWYLPIFDRDYRGKGHRILRLYPRNGRFDRFCSWLVLQRKNTKK